jgi:hypothetical protein
MEHPFDHLAKTLAEGVSRREALRRLGGGMAGFLLASLGLGRAWGQDPRDLEEFCRNIPPGHERDKCMTEGQRGGGLFEACEGQRSRLCVTPRGKVICCPKGHACCDGECRDVLFDVSNCGACDRVCARDDLCDLPPRM